MTLKNKHGPFLSPPKRESSQSWCDVASGKTDNFTSGAELKPKSSDAFGDGSHLSSPLSAVCL